MNLECELSEKQSQALEKLLDSTTRTVVFGGSAGGGKSWLGCAWLIIMAITYPYTKWFIGREELKRLVDSTYVTFIKVSNSMRVTGQWTYDAQKHVVKFKNGSMINFISMEYAPRDPLFERLGSTEYTGGFIEEAGEIHFNAFDTIKSRTGRHYNDEYGLLPTILITCNPKKNWLYTMFYKPHKAGMLGTDSCFIQSLVTDNPKISKEYIYNLENLKNEVQKQRLLYGVWEYEDDPEQLIKYEWVEKCFYSHRFPGKSTLGVDVARYGNDSSTYAKMSGNILVELKAFKDVNPTAYAYILIDKLIVDSIDTDRIGIDVVGLGAGTVDTMVREKYKVVEIISGDAQKTFKETQKYNFYNLRSQMWWVMREDMENGRIKIDLDINDEITQKLIEDLTAPCYEIRGEKTIKVESKDDIKQRIGRSTDYADSFVYANWIRNLKDVKSAVDKEIVQQPKTSLSDLLF